MSSTARRWLLLATAAALLFCAGFLLAPVIDGHRLGQLLRLAYRPACHQLADRCLDLGFGPLAVCARCAGLYCGGLMAMAATCAVGRSVRPRPRWLAAVAVPTAVDWAAGIVGLPNLPNWPRFAIAIPVGLLLGLFLVDAVVEALDRPAADSRRDDSAASDPVQ